MAAQQNNSSMRLSILYAAAIIGGVILLGAAAASVKFDLNELQISLHDRETLLSWRGDDDDSWLPFHSTFEAFKAMVWMLVIINMVRGLTGVLLFGGGFTNKYEVLKAFRLLSRSIQILEVILLLFFRFVWKVPVNVGHMAPKFAVEIFIIVGELVFREGLLAFVAIEMAALRQPRGTPATETRPEKTAGIAGLFDDRLTLDPPPPYCLAAVSAPVPDAPSDVANLQAPEELPPPYSPDFSRGNALTHMV